MLEKVRGFVVLAALPALLCTLPSCSRADEKDGDASRIKVRPLSSYHGVSADIAFEPGGPRGMCAFGGPGRPIAAAGGLMGTPPFPPPFFPPGGPPPGLSLAGLDLSDAQLESIYSKRSESADRIDLLLAQVHTKRRRLLDLILQPTVDAVAVHSTQAEISQLLSKIDGCQTDLLLDTQSVLTPEQKAKLRIKLMRRAVDHPMPHGLP